jgi:hypothetical protein
MSELIEIIINQKKQLLKLYCGNCGDSAELIFEITEDNKINVIIKDSNDMDSEDYKEHFLSPIEIII